MGVCEVSGNAARRAVAAFGCCALLSPVLFAAAPVIAADVTGRITVHSSDTDVLPGMATVPLAGVEVHIGVLELLGSQGIHALYAHVASGFTDEDGSYTIDIGPDPGPQVPTVMVHHAVVVILESEDRAISVYDNQTDSVAPACLGTPATLVANRGTTQVDIEVTVRSDNDTDYESSGSEFHPSEDTLVPPVVGRTPHCTRDELGMPVLPEPLYDQRGLTNTVPDRFSHLAAHYARAFDAYRFTRDGLGKGSFTPARVNAWEGGVPLSYSYLCSTHAIQMPPERSQILGSDRDSRIYAMRHEYGHHLMCASPIAGVDMSPARGTGNTAHGGLQNSSSAASWSEGFAAWYPAAVAEFNGEDRPYVLQTKAGEINLLFGDAQIDDPFTAGEQPTHGSLGEEFAIATLLWQISDQTGTALLSDSLEDATDLIDLSRVYVALSSDLSVTGFFDTLPCDFVDTGALVFGLDCLFIDRGFYHDTNGDGLFGPREMVAANELVGFTRWPLEMLGPTDFRPDTPEIDGSTLRLTVEDELGDPIDVSSFLVEIQYDPPFDTEDSQYRQTVLGSGPYDIPIMLPAKPSSALVTPVLMGSMTPAPLVIDSAFFHESVNPFREGGVAPVLSEHTFVVVPEPEGSMLAAVVVLGLLRRLRRRDLDP